MKQLLIILIFISGSVQAQKIEVLRNDKLTGPVSGDFIVSGVSPDGKMILASEPGYKGLYSIEVFTRSIVKISDMPGAGYKPCFSADGRSVYFRADEFSGSGKYSSLLKYDMSLKETETIESKTRDLTPPILHNNRILYSAAGTRKERATASGEYKSGQENIYVMVENLKPVLYINGMGKLFTPNGEGNYIWASLSPDKTKLLYNFGGTCTYVCSLDGKILDNMGRLNAPEWINNEIIVGMNDIDDGYRVLSSDIICYSRITKKKTNLTATNNMAEMYPLPFSDGKRIVYQTLTGDLFIMSLNIK